MRFSRIIVTILAISISLSCSSIQSGSDRSKLESENHILKNKEILLARRNSVLEDENNSIRKDLKDKSARVVSLEREQKSLNEAHANEIKLWQQKYENLTGKIAILEKESAQKIKDLSDLNKKMETDLGEKIRNLNEDMKKREIESARILEEEKKTSTKREYTLRGDIENLKKEVTDRDEKLIQIEEKIRKLQEDANQIRIENESLKKMLKGSD